MKFFLDNNLSPSLARALNELSGRDHEVVHLRDRFDTDVTDVHWITQLGEEGDWVILTRDDAINRKPQERDALRQSGLTAFFLAVGWKHQHAWDIAWRLVRWWPDIIAQAELVQEGASFKVPVQCSGKFKQL